MAKSIQIDSPDTQPVERNRRILVVDDNPSIHEDFRKILASSKQGNAELEHGETALFGKADQTVGPETKPYELAFASSGEEAIKKVQASIQSGDEYALVFMDVRMAPGIDGVEATVQLLKMSSDIQIVICTAYSDYSWSEMHEKIGESDRVLILKKPFDNIEVLQCASSLTEKWRLQKEANRAIEGLTTFIRKQMDTDASIGESL